MPPDGIHALGRSLGYYTAAQETMANNLANVSSEAFKAFRITARQDADGPFPVPVQELDLSQGALRQTGRPLDVALEGPGFLVVRTATGERLFRGGGLELDGVGRLTDRHGDPLLDSDGRIIALPPGDIAIRRDGTILVDDAPVGQLHLVTAPPDQLRKEGQGRYLALTPPAPLEGGLTTVREGMLEEANIDAVRGMMDLLLIQRAYATNVEAMRTLDGVLGTVVSDVGRV